MLRYERDTESGNDGLLDGFIAVHLHADLRLETGLLEELLHQHTRTGSDLARDEGFLGKVRGGELSSCQAVAGRGHDDMRVLSERPHFDLDVGRRLPHHRNIEIVAAQGVANIFSIADPQYHVDLRKSVRETRDGERYKILCRADRTDRDTSAAAACNHVQRLFAIQQSGFNPIGQSLYLTPCIGEQHAIARPLDQGQSSEFLQVAQLLGHRWLGDMQAIGRPCK